MARPRKKVIKQRVNLSLSPELHAAAQEYAYEKNESLSGMVERLLSEAMVRQPLPAGVVIHQTGNGNKAKVGRH